MSKCPTVNITADNEQGFIVINESDLKDTDTVFGEAAKPKGKTKAANKSDQEDGQKASD